MAPGEIETIAADSDRAARASAAFASSWLLSETGTATYSIAAVVGPQRSALGTQPPAVLSRSEGLLTLFFLIQQRTQQAGILDRSSLNLLSSAHASVLLARLLQAQASQFPWLAEQCLDSRHPSGIRSSELQNLQQLLDTVRLHEREEGLIGKAIDDFGNVDLSQSWTAELLGVLAEYEQLQTECARFDAVGILEKLLSALNALTSETWQQLGLPQSITLYRPSQIFALEAAIFRRIAELTSLSLEFTPRVAALVCSAETLEAPSTRYLKSLQRFVASLAKVPPRKLPEALPQTLAISREQLVETIIDGAHLADPGTRVSEPETTLEPTAQGIAQGIWVWENQDQIVEVQRLVGSIRQAIREGLATPNDYQVLCFGLSDYRAKLEHELARANLPFQISTPQAASSTLGGDYLKTMLHWLRAPSLSSARTLLLHPMLATQQLSADDIEQFLARIQPLLAPDPAASAQIQAFARSQLTETTPSPTDLLHELTRRGYGDEDSVWDTESFDLFLSKALSMLARGLRADEKFRNRPEQFLGAVLGSLIVLEREFRKRQTLAAGASTEQCMREFSKLFHEKRRKRAPKGALRDRGKQVLHDPQLESVTRKNTQATWILHRQLRKTRREYEAVERTIPAALPASAGDGSVWAETLELISTSTNSLALPAASPVAGAILVSDFSDARPVLRKAVCVLGCTSSALQHQGADEHPLAPDLASIGQTIRSLAGNAQRFDERAFTFAELLCESSELVLSAPESTIRETAQPAWISLELAAFQDPAAAAGAQYFPPCPDSSEPSASQTAALPPRSPTSSFSTQTIVRIERATAQLLARQSPQLTEYDGNLGPEALPLLARVLRPQRFFQGSFCYSVSNLAKLSEDPFQFFLKEFLRVTPLRSSMIDELAAKTGTLIHSALEMFFRERPATLQQRLETHFPLECRRLLEIASAVFEQDEFDWDGHTYLNAVRSYLLMGLDTANERRRGPLLAALVIQRDLLKTMPCELEWEFGPKGANPLLLDSEHGTFGVAGKIDRIDEVQLGNGSAKSIWDYKTGTAAKPNDIVKLRNLQIPLYAAAVRQLLGEIPVSGGQLELKNPNRRDENYATYNEGVKLEHLAIARKGNSTEHLPNNRGAVESIIDAACDAAKALHARCALGRFAPGKAKDREPGFAALYPAEGAVQMLKWSDAYPESAAAPDDAQEEECTPETQISELASLVPSDPPSISPPELVSINRFLQAKFPDMSRERPTAEQEAALALEYPVCLRAGAGSGKTFVLRSRVLELIRRGEPIQSIAAITFTQKAADEIRHRIEQGISAVLRANALTGVPLELEERQRFLTAKWHLHQAQIGTIHSLASRIIALDPILADTGGIEGTLVATEQSAETERAVRAVLSGAGAINGRASFARSTEISQDILQLLAMGISHWQVREQVLRLLRAPRQLESLQKVFPPDGGINTALLAETLDRFRIQLAAQLRRKLDRFIEQAQADLQAWLPIAVDEKLLSAPQEAAHRAILGALQSLRACSEPDGWLRAVLALEHCVLENYNSGNKKKSKKVPRNYFKELKEKIAGVIGSYRQCLDFSVDREASGWEAVAALCRLGAEARNRYTLQKSELRVVDFDDQLAIAHRMICKPPPRAALARQHQLVAKLRAQFRHFLVDEFQDTDPLQWELIYRLADLRANATADESLGQPLGPNKSFFMVGDVQQAIYGFRGGDIRVFQAAAEVVQQAEGKSLSLSGNYRSHPNILEFINTFFAALFAVDHQPVDRTESAPEVFAQRPIQFQHLDARRTDPNDSARAELSEADQPEQEFRVFSLLRPYDSSEHRQGISVEAERVAHFVQSVLAELNAPAAASSRWNALRPYHVNQYHGGAKIALLTRTGKQQLALADALARLEIPYSLSQSSGFYQLDEIKPLIQAIRLQVYPEDTVALVAVLRSPLFGLTDAELVNLFAELGSNWEQIWQPPDPAGESLSNSIRTELAQWRRAAQQLLPSAFLEKIVTSSGLLTAYQRANQNEAAQNINRCIERIRLLEAEQASGCSGSEVLHWLERQIGDQAESPNSNSESHSVVLMTIHKAKGLEFPMVILPFLDACPQRAYDFAIAELQRDTPPAATDPYFSVMGIKLEDEDEGGSREKTATLELAQAARNRAEYLEAKRVFYVAASRAREYLVLSMRERKADKPPPEPEETSLAGAWLDTLMQRLEDSDHFVTSYNNNDFVVPVLQLGNTLGQID